MTISNGIKKRSPVYSDVSCICGKVFTPLTSRQKHCSPECRFKSIASEFVHTTGCWEWPKSYFKQTGYGQFAIDSESPITAHRMAYLVFVGPIPEGMYICHKCDNRSCFNPDHLFVGTPKDNVHDMFSKGRENTKKPSGSKNARYGLPNMTARKFSTDMEALIVEKVKTMSIRAVARDLSCSHSTIRRVLRTEDELAG